MNLGIRDVIAVGVPYLIAVGACYMFGYWGTFHINVLEFISFADVAKLAILCLSACFSRPQWVVSWDASTEFPQEPAAVPTTVCQRGRLRGVSDGMPLARWVPVSEVRSDVRVRLGRPPALAVCLLPLSGLCDGRDNPPQFEDPAHDVVLGCVSDDDG